MIPNTQFTVQHTESQSKGKFYIEVNGKELAKMTYSKAGDTRIIIDHTEVDDQLRGQDAGKQMVEASVAYARKNGIKILPLCPFAKSVFQKNPALQDVL